MLSKLQYFVLGAVLMRIALEIAIHLAPARSATKTSNPNTKAVSWSSRPKTYCSGKGSTKVSEESFKPYEDKYGKSGFGFTQPQCQQSCEELVDCNFFSFGTWEKNLWGWVPGPFTGYMRCQVYSTCHVSDFEGSAPLERRTKVFDKPWLLRYAQEIVIAASVLLAICSVLVVLNAAADNGFGRKVGFPCSCIAAAVSVWLGFQAGLRFEDSWDFQSKMVFALIAVHALISLALLGVALMDNPRRPGWILLGFGRYAREHVE